MKILVNAVPFTGLLTGIGRAMRCLYREIEKIPGVKVYYFDGVKAVDAMPSAVRPEAWIKAASNARKLPDHFTFLLRSAWWLRCEQKLRKVIRHGNYDIYHETGFIPAAQDFIPMVHTIYDLSLTTYRDKHPRERVWFHGFFFPRRVKYIGHILTISSFIKDEIHQVLGFPSHKISAVPLAADDHFCVADPKSVQNQLRSFNLPERFFLFVGSLEPRKNLNLIIETMIRMKDPLPLVLAGWAGWGDKSWLNRLEAGGLKSKVIMTGFVNDQDLAALYNRAVGLLYPSLYEGFGLPILEAMACGCPVICSRAASMPEVAGNAALLIDPHSHSELASAMEALAVDDETRLGMIREGAARVAQFTWAGSAQKTLKVFEMVVSRKRG